ncbi:hypothetical protein V1525DRAFT_392110, partial [Lipomyces kononenkoae]
MSNVLMPLADAVQNLGGAELGLHGFGKATVKTGLLALLDTMIAVVQDIRRVYNRLDLRLIRAPSTMRLNITYDVTRVPDKDLTDNLRSHVKKFFENCRAGDRAPVF